MVNYLSLIYLSRLLTVAWNYKIPSYHVRKEKFQIATCLSQYHYCLAGNGNLKQVKVVFTLSEREREHNVAFRWILWKIKCTICIN